MADKIEPVAWGIEGYAIVVSAAQKQLGMSPGANEALYSQNQLDTLVARAERAEAEAAALRSVTSRVTEAFRALWSAKDEKAAAQCQRECEAAVTALFVEDMTQSTPRGQEG